MPVITLMIENETPKFYCASRFSDSPGADNHVQNHSPAPRSNHVCNGRGSEFPGKRRWGVLTSAPACTPSLPAPPHLLYELPPPQPFGHPSSLSLCEAWPSKGEKMCTVAPGRLIPTKKSPETVGVGGGSKRL